MSNRFLSTIKIRGKIRFVSWLSSTLALLLMMIGYGFYQNQTEQLTTVTNVSAIGELLAANVSDALYNLDSATAATQLESIKIHPRIYSACLFDQDDRLFAHFESPDTMTGFNIKERLRHQGIITASESNPENIACPPAFKDMSKNGLPGIRKAGKPFLEREVARDIGFVAYPVASRGTVYGRLYLIYARPIPFENLTQHAPIFIFLFLIGMAIAVLLADTLQKEVSGPIIRLAATMRRIAEEKNFTMRMVKTSGDEIGTMIEQFNRMLDEIENRDRELQDNRVNLENVILARTRELEKARIESQHAHDLTNQILNAIPDPVCVKDYQFRYIAGNHAFNSLFIGGLSPIGKTDTELFPAKEAENIHYDDLRVLDEGASTCEIHFPLKHGLTRPFIARKVRVKGRDGRAMIVATLRSMNGEGGIEQKKSGMPPAKTSVTLPPAAPPLAQPLHILVIDENPINQRVAQDVFALLGHAIDITDESTAQQKILHKKYHAIFVALRRPEDTVLAEDLRKPQREGAAVPVLIVAMVSESGGLQDESLRAAGFDAVMQKPLLARAVADFLQNNILRNL